MKLPIEVIKENYSQLLQKMKNFSLNKKVYGIDSEKEEH